MSDPVNRQILLASRPTGEPLPENFRLASVPVPTCGDGEALVRTLWLSVDPYMRGRMRDAASYAKPVPIDGVMEGETVARVVESRHEGFAVGDNVVCRAGWQDYSLLRPPHFKGAYKVATESLPLSTALGVVGMPGGTAYFGLLEIGLPKPGETLVVSAAAGAVGSAVGQIGKIKGCRVVGIAGGKHKCDLVVNEYGFDACLDYKSESDLPAALAAACPDGVDIYFENVGGAVLEAVMPLFNKGSRIPICGFVSQYNKEGEQQAPWDMVAQLADPPTGRFFLVGELGEKAPAARAELAGWVADGRLKYRETIAEGLDNAPAAFMGMLKGQNIGKQLVKIA